MVISPPPIPVETHLPVAEPPAAPSGLTTRLVDPKQLAEYEEAWWRLSGTAIAPNAFYDPWMLMPAIRLHEDPTTLRFLLVFGSADKNGVEPLLGLFPLEIQTKCLHLPIRTLAFWQTRHGLLTVPLIDGNHVWEVLDAFWRWFEHNPLKCRILDTNYLAADGKFHQVWTDFAIGRSSLILRDFPRAFLVASGTAAAYISASISKKHYDEYLRLERRLADIGKLEYRQVEDRSEVDAWVDEFLRLESSGWKGGGSGTAYAKEWEDTEHFRAITQEGFRHDRVMLLSLVLDGKAIAMKHNLLAGDGGFTLRIAYDESYARYSPGVLLEMENIRRTFDHPRVKWLDSCAKPRHTMADRIWRERRMIRRTLFSDGSRLGDFWMAVIPLLRWVRQRVKRQPDPDYLQIRRARKSGSGDSRE